MRREKMAFPGSKETWASRAIGVRSAHLVPEEKMVLKARKAVEVRMATQVLWDPQGRKENSESRGYQVTQEDKGQRVPLDFLDFPVPMERRVAGAPLGSQDLGDNAARRVHGVKEAPGASLGSLAPRATLEVMARPALRVNGDPMDPKDPRAFLDQRAPLALRARMGSQDTLDREARPVSKARPAPQVLQVWSALRVPQEKLVQWASEATLGPQAPQVNRGSQALPGKKGRRVTQAPLAFLGKMALQDYAAFLGTEASLVQWERLD